MYIEGVGSVETGEYLIDLTGTYRLSTGGYLIKVANHVSLQTRVLPAHLTVGTGNNWGDLPPRPPKNPLRPQEWQTQPAPRFRR